MSQLTTRKYLGYFAWTLTALEIIIAVVILGNTGAAANGFQNDLLCDIPTKLNYNLAISVITLIGIIVLAILDGVLGNRFRRYASLSWIILAVVYGVLIVLWAGATGSAFYTCSDLCSACGRIEANIVIYGGRCCECDELTGTATGLCTDGVGAGDEITIGYETKHYWYQATQALDIVMLLLFVLSLAVVISKKVLFPNMVTPQAYQNPAVVPLDPVSPPTYEDRGPKEHNMGYDSTTKIVRKAVPSMGG